MSFVENMDNRPQIFWPKSNRIMTVLLPIIVVVLLIANAGNSVEGPSLRSVIIALVIGFVIFLFMFAITPRAKVSIENDQIFYRKKSLNLNELAAVDNKTRYMTRGAGALNASFRMQLTDRANNHLTIPLGNWVDQEILLSIIGNYATKSGATLNKQATNLIEKAKQI